MINPSLPAPSNYLRYLTRIEKKWEELAAHLLNRTAADWHSSSTDFSLCSESTNSTWFDLAGLQADMYIENSLIDTPLTVLLQRFDFSSNLAAAECCRRRLSVYDGQVIESINTDIEMKFMRLYKTLRGAIAESEDHFYLLAAAEWDHLINHEDLPQFLASELRRLEPQKESSFIDTIVQAPIQHQEVWAAGVTYYRSRDARMEESKDAGGGDFYDRVYTAGRPELFFKSSPHRVAGPGEEVRIRQDSQWNVPEPELALVVTSTGKIIGYTIGNDMSSRDIEGENPLYLPQAKVYDKSCALGPCILVRDEPLPDTTEIKMEIIRQGETCYKGATPLSAMKRTPQELVEFLYRDNSFPHGCFLLTGTGIVPPDSFTLQSEDEIRITINPIGTLINTVQ